jgi:hypothetical protein
VPTTLYPRASASICGSVFQGSAHCVASSARSIAADTLDCRPAALRRNLQTGPGVNRPGRRKTLAALGFGRCRTTSQTPRRHRGRGPQTPAKNVPGIFAAQSACRTGRLCGRDNSIRRRSHRRRPVPDDLDIAVSVYHANYCHCLNFPDYLLRAWIGTYAQRCCRAPIACSCSRQRIKQDTRWCGRSQGIVCMANETGRTTHKVDQPTRVGWVAGACRSRSARDGVRRLHP